MNHAQKKYAMERVDNIKKVKLAAIKLSCAIPYKTLTIKDGVKLILAKKVKVRSDCNTQKSVDRLNLANIFDFSQYHQPYAHQYDEKSYNKLAKPVIAKAQAIKDEFMLGDAKEALKMIEDFVNFE